MSSNYIFIISLSFGLFFSSSLIAQSPMSANDSTWCDHLDEIIKCASLDIVTDRMAVSADTGSTIAPFTPLLRLGTHTETMAKEYNKITYTGYLYASAALTSGIDNQMAQWHKKIKSCLPQWSEARLPNSDKHLKSYPDYFITNSEDETTLRLDVYHLNGMYYIRLRIF